jgi:hypothetical protein
MKNLLQKLASSLLAFVILGPSLVHIPFSFAGPPTGIQLVSLNPAEAGYTNNQNINFSFNHGTNDNRFLVIENPAVPACAGMNPLTAPGTTGPEINVHALSGGDGTKTVDIHLVDEAGDGCGGTPDIFTAANQNIVLDTGAVNPPNQNDFSYDFANNTANLANPIVDAGSGLDYQVFYTGGGCGALPNNWNDAPAGGTGFGGDGAGIAANPGLFGAPGGAPGQDVCLRVRDKAGNVSAMVADGQVPTPPITGGVAAGTNPIDVIDATNVANVSVDVVFAVNPPAGQVFVTLADTGAGNVQANGASNLAGTTTTIGGINASALLDGTITIMVGFQDATTGHISTASAGVNATKGVSTGGSRHTLIENALIIDPQTEDQDLALGPDTSPVTSDLIADCGCAKENKALNNASFDLFDAYINNGNNLLCLNPGCFDSPVVEPTSITEEFLINALKERQDASKKLREKLDKETKAEKNVKNKQAKAGNENLDFAQVTLEGKKEGESKADYDARRKEAALERQRAFDELRVAERELQDSKAERRKATREHDKAKKKVDDAYEAAKEEFGIDKAYEMYKKGQKAAELGPVCIDPVCGGGAEEIVPFQLSYEAAESNLQTCLNQCNVSAGIQNFSFEASLVSESEEILTVSGEEPAAFSEISLGPLVTTVSPSDLEPFESLSGVEEYIPASFFASDIEGHPDEAFLLELYHIGAVKGKGESKKFAPNETMTRAALLKVALEVFGYEVPSIVLKKPFKDVDLKQWHAKYFDAGAKNKISLGYGDQSVPQGEREAIPWQEVSLIETLAMFTRAANIDVSLAEDYKSEYVDDNNPDWWHNIWKWSEMNGLVNTEQLSYQEKTDQDVEGEETIDHKAKEEASPGYTIVVVYPKDDPDSLIKRHGLALAIKILALKKKEPCNCDKEKAAWEAAEKDAAAKQEAANIAEEAAQKSEKAAGKAEGAAKAAQQAVDDLDKYDDDSSSATGEDDKTITTGDLRLMELAKAEIDQQVDNGDKTLEEGQKEKEGINKDKLPELRARRDALTKLAREKRDAADKAAKEARSKADSDRAKADKAQKDADDAKKAAEDAKKAYDECVKKCKLIKEQVAAEKKRLEAERKKRALAAARAKAVAKAKAAAKARADAKAEADRQAREDAAERDRQNSGSSGGGGDEDEDFGPIPSASKDPCKEKFLQAVAARGKQVAEARPDDVEDFDPDYKAAVDVGTGIGELIGAAAQAAAGGAKSAVQIAGSLAALPQVLYGFWVDYVASAALKGGKGLIGGRICQVYQASTTGKCGYEVLNGQVVYWERDAAGNMSVVIMGPGDSVEQQQCKK